MSAPTYGEEPLRPEWAATGARCLRAGAGACLHGGGQACAGHLPGLAAHQCGLGGSLVQDLPSLRPGPVQHETTAYERNAHNVRFVPGGQMAQWFGPVSGGPVASIHHQAIARLGKGVEVEATADDDA